MAVPFDTLKLARQFEAAGFDSKQAGDMAAAISEAVVSADLATREDVEKLGAALRSELKVAVRDLKIWTGSITVAAITVLFTALHIWPPH